VIGVRLNVVDALKIVPLRLGFRPQGRVPVLLRVRDGKGPRGTPVWPLRVSHDARSDSLTRATATPCWRRSAANEGLLTQGTSSDSSALTSTDSSVRDRAAVSPIADALLLVEQTGHDNDAGAPVAGYRNRT
jgi:hypothetical protein